jgi:hypothetical protein
MTRPTSRTTDLAPMVPKVMICATESRPYFPHVFDYVRAAIVREIDVDVRRVDPFRIEEPFEEQSVTDRIDVGNLQEIGDNRTGRGSARHTGNASAAPVADEIAHNDEVTGEPVFSITANSSCTGR